jgi:hypothetical protein
VKSLATARKNCKKFQEIFKKVNDDEALKERRYKRLSIGNGVEPPGADQRNLITKASITNIPAEVENAHQESFRKLAQAHDGPMMC